ncbi:autophagy-related protein 16 [Exophiala viscosa]|uniref:autophagy-related protein 16 n=1 Tax=Exophiala viscosa TaxID=2486360 RepID=UPI0021A04105|nr:autophagy-related protein 16 [Exophiala viscosa]
MATWSEQYLAALRARAEVEQANLELYDYCTKLADQKAELHKKASSHAQAPREEGEPVTSPQPSLMSMGMGMRRVTSPPVARPDSPNLAQLRQDLAKAQQERGDLQTRLESVTRELETLKARGKADSKRIAQLTASVSQLTVKLRDREEELRGKAKLIENVQDENVTLNLQLNMAEEQVGKLNKDNKELVDRWMASKGKEADRMNKDSKFG